MMWSLGFMSGTSLDGVDAALLRTDGVSIAEFGPSAYRPYTDQERGALRSALERAAAGAPAAARDPARWTMEAALVADAHIDAAARLDAGRAAIVGFHGQTILHRPEHGVTAQIGDAARLAAALGAPVAHDFRSADVAAGGQGAPLASFYHFALARHAGFDAPCAFLNMGGVGNVTFVDPRLPAPEAPGALLAFDTGPANAPIDDFIRARTGAAFDADGATAAAGTADAALVARWTADAAYLRAAPPKSLDRNDFARIAGDLAGASVEDGAASLTAFAAACVGAAAAFSPAPPTRWLVTGGGRRNRALMGALAARLSAPVEAVEAIGADGDALEAQAFAYLAARSLAGLPLSAPGVTGCPRPIRGGVILRPGATAA